MCGIAGIYQTDGSPVEAAALHRMTEIIAYRGPDGFGHWHNAGGQLALGHRRLSILDLSTAGHQPMHYMGLTITFNGEIYNYKEVREQLKAKGYQFKTGSDTEVLLAAYHHKGKECLKDLDGMFAFAIWDESRQELFCARDRFGEKPFYYYYDGRKFVFGSEIKQLFAFGIERSINPEVLHYYCSHQTLLNPSDLSQTFFGDVKQLPHSHCIHIGKSGQLKISRYWDIDYQRVDTRISMEQACETFDDLFRQSIARRLRSDVPVGTSLSGGLDSTSIAAAICRIQPEAALNSFTASFPGFEKDETDLVRMLNQRYEKIDPHFVTPMGDEFLKDVGQLLFHQDEPIPDTSMYAQYRVMRLARENNVTVLLDGQGSDEFMAGYYQYWPVRLREMFAFRDKNYLSEKQQAEAIMGQIPEIRSNLAMMLRYPVLYKGLSRVKNKILPAKVSAPLPGVLAENYYRPEVADTGDSISWDRLNPVLYSTVFKNGVQSLLRFADRNSMAHSREVRLPFLDHKLVEFVFTLPSHYKMNQGWSKYLLRKSQSGYLPEAICWRRNKVGYATPQAEWMKLPLFAGQQEDRKAALLRTGMFKPEFIQNLDVWTTVNLHYLLMQKL